jgi:hypothetical protein
VAETKTAKNRARRQKKRDRAAGKTRQSTQATTDTVADDATVTKKRRLVNEAALRLHQAEGSGTEDAAEDAPEPDSVPNPPSHRLTAHEDAVQVAIHED